VDGTAALFPISDTPNSFTQPAIPPGGLVALDVRSGEILWRRAPEEAVCSWGKEFCLSASIAAATAIPGAVFQGTADGHVRAYSTSGGSPLWDFDTGRSFRAVNGIDATGGQVNGWPVDGAVYGLGATRGEAEMPCSCSASTVADGRAGRRRKEVLAPCAAAGAGRRAKRSGSRPAQPPRRAGSPPTACAV
jgi:hypothetical protein